MKLDGASWREGSSTPEVSIRFREGLYTGSPDMTGWKERAVYWKDQDDAMRKFLTLLQSEQSE